jgi:Protein of unknown function (DUF1569)
MPTLFDTTVLQNITSRLHTLEATTNNKWGKMNPAQMLKHCSMAIGTATGDSVIKTNFFMKLMAPLIKKLVLSPKDYKPGLPTAKEFIITEYLDFEEEKAKLLTQISKFIAMGEKGVDGIKHPAFGKLTAYEWGFSQWKHLDHHLKQFGK